MLGIVIVNYLDGLQLLLERLPIRGKGRLADAVLSGIRVSSVARRHGFRQGESTNRAVDVGGSLRDRTGFPPEENA